MYRKEERTVLGDFRAHRSIFRSRISAVYQTACWADAVPRVSDVAARQPKITAPYSKWVKANDYTN